MISQCLLKVSNLSQQQRRMTTLPQRDLNYLINVHILYFIPVIIVCYRISCYSLLEDCK